MSDATQNTDNENTQTQENSGNENNPTQNEGTIQFKQSDLDALINAKYKKGAEKATSELLKSLGVANVDDLKLIIEAKKQADEASKSELDKAMEKIATLENEKTNFSKQYEAMQLDSKMNALALQNGIKEIDYFKFEYQKAAKESDFDEAEFVSKLIESKGKILGIDNTTSNVPNPNSKNNQKGAIRRADFVKLTASEQMKVAASGISIID